MLDRVGNSAVELLASIGEASLFALKAAREIFVPPFEVRETGPLTAGLLLSGRIGAGIGAELGAMRVTEQIDALEASAVDSFRYLVVTRVIACVVALPILTTIMNFTGMFGGFIAETTDNGMPLGLYFRRAFSLIELTDYVPATLKTMVFGFIIATTSSYLGFNTASG